MNQNDTSDDPDGQLRFQQMASQLASLEVSRVDISHLHLWMLEQRREYIIEKAIDWSAAGMQKFTEQVQICNKLKEYADFMSKQFDFLNQFSAFDAAFTKAYNAVTLTGTERDHLSKPRELQSFRDSLRSDAELLSLVVSQTLANMEMIIRKRGRPSNAWRNKLFTDLVHRIVEIGNNSLAKSTEVGLEVWNIYFNDNKIIEDEAAWQIIQREQQRRKLQ
jgi:hypothetical protein